jgi:UDP-GlcNAc:undecaprenyl-phosphate GlcNAc-1-phosphate transferase
MLDLGLSIIRRRLKGRPIFSADRGHVHHQLVARGLTVRRVAMVLYAAGIVGGIFGLLISFSGGHMLFSVILAAGAIAAALAGIRELRYAEFQDAGRLLFRGE